jgi:hypothetical protein
MTEWLPATVVGMVLVIVGSILMRSHVISWRGQKNDSSLDDADRKHYHARYRRRMQTSCLIAILGILLALGDTFVPAKEQPLLFTIYWLSVLLLAAWVAVLGVGDLISTGAHSRAALARVHRKQRELEREVNKLRSRGSNGHSASS